MTERDLYDAALIEINKLEAPSMLLEDYNYFINKAIQQYINKAYNRYEINQQATDDLRALKTTVALIVNDYTETPIPNEDFYFFAVLPTDYMHILNCVVEFEKKSGVISTGCDKNNSKNKISSVARKLTSDVYPAVINNAYFKPSYKVPYYSVSYMTEDDVIAGKILQPCLDVYADKASIITRLLNPCGEETPDWNGGAVLNIRCGDTKKYTPVYAYVDYIKTPNKIELTENNLKGADNTKTLEFSDYVCYEIINEFVKLLLENASDPRLQTNIPINQTIIPQVTE